MSTNVELTKPSAVARVSTPGPRLASVNLLSPVTLESLAVQKVRRRLIAAGLVGAVVVGGGWLAEGARLHSAQHRLATEQAQTAPLQAQLAALEPVARFFAQLDARKQAASSAMAAEVLFSKALSDLNTRTPQGLQINSMSVTLTPSVVTSVSPPVSPLVRAGLDANGQDVAKSGTGAAASTPTTPVNPAASSAASSAVTCARPDPFHPAAIIGCVTLSGTAPSRDVVGQFVNNLKAGTYYADPFVTTTTITGADGTEMVQFSGSVGLTGAAVSGRYTDLSWLSDPKVLAAAEKMVASGNTAGSRLAKQTAAQQAAAKAAAEAAAKAQAAADTAAQQAAEAAAAKQLQDAAAAAVAAANAAAANQANHTGQGN
ncbi:MAG TPA: hypothetical protein VE081_13370 [Sporichthyaceae bacterium]|nr:hypothetical protein [Sporichthyaceae bacterium]